METEQTLLLISIPFVLILTYTPFTISNSWIKYICLVSNALAFYLLTALHLSFAADQAIGIEKDKLKNSKISSPWISTTRILGTYTGLYILSIPIIFPNSDPILNTLLRVTTFFYGCKILDLATRPTPPILLDQRKPRLKYMTLLLTQTRYSSFNIAVNTPRLKITTSFWTHYTPAIIILPLTLLFPTIAELKILSSLVIIQHGLETLHSIFHGSSCPSGPLFQNPFASKTLSEFWGIRWHQGAQPFLYGLGYLPASRGIGRKSRNKDVARAAGILAAFNLSGIWHGWCAAALVEKEYTWIVGIGLWGVFMLQGLGCLVERLIWKKENQGGWIQRILVWTYAIETGAIWIRIAEPKRVKIAWLENLIS